VNLRRAGVRPFELPLGSPLATAHGEIAGRVGRLVVLEDTSGLRGLGEATPLPDFGTEDLSSCDRILSRALHDLASHPTRDVEAQLHSVARIARDAPCARAALELALCDLASQHQKKTLAQWIGDQAELEGAESAEELDTEEREPEAQEVSEGAETSEIAIQALVGGGSPRAVEAATRRAAEEGFDAFKLKLAVSSRERSVDRDLDRVAALRSAAGPDARLRLDANEAWDFAQAQAALERLAGFEIDFIEQPVSRTDFDGLVGLDRESPIRVAADEALQGEGFRRCLAAGGPSVFVVKPAALGGVRASMGLAREARSRGIRVVWSSLIEGAVGRAGAMHLAAALGQKGEVHGLGTGRLLARDFFAESPAAPGHLGLERAAGIGASQRVDFEAQAPYWTGPPRFFAETS
jgi:o-succinylbenzoate synthase